MAEVLLSVHTAKSLLNGLEFGAQNPHVRGRKLTSELTSELHICAMHVHTM